MSGWLARLVTCIAALVLAAVGAGLLVQRCQLADERAAREMCEQRAEQLGEQAGAAEAQLAAYRAQVEEQNQQVEVLRAKAEALQERAESAGQRIVETRIEYRDRVRRVLAAPVPSDCEAAVRWGAQQARAAAAAWRDGR